MFKKKQKDPLSRYEDPIGGFSSRDLRLGTWYVRHKEQLRAVFVICFIIVDVVLLGYGFWGWAEYATIGYRQDQRMYANQVVEIENYAVQQSRYGARDLQFASPETYSSGLGKYDFVIDVLNANDRWIAAITYQFGYGDQLTEPAIVTIMPGARIPLAELGVSVSGKPGSVRFVPLAVDWQHVDPHTISDPVDYISKRNNFVVDDISFLFADAQQTSGHHLTFTVFNDSVFNYWTPQFIVELRDGSRRVGVVPLTIDAFGAGETRTVNVQLFAEHLFVGDMVLYPLLNFFDTGEYIQ